MTFWRAKEMLALAFIISALRKHNVVAMWQEPEKRSSPASWEKFATMVLWPTTYGTGIHLIR